MMLSATVDPVYTALFLACPCMIALLIFLLIQCGMNTKRKVQLQAMRKAEAPSPSTTTVDISAYSCDWLLPSFILWFLEAFACAFVLSLIPSESVIFNPILHFLLIGAGPIAMQLQLLGFCLAFMGLKRCKHYRKTTFLMLVMHGIHILASIYLVLYFITC